MLATIQFRIPYLTVCSLSINIRNVKMETHKTYNSPLLWCGHINERTLTEKMTDCLLGCCAVYSELRASKNSVLRRIFKVTGGEELHNLYSSSDTIRMINQAG
jgi:hypothetical protein